MATFLYQVSPHFETYSHPTCRNFFLYTAETSISKPTGNPSFLLLGDGAARKWQPLHPIVVVGVAESLLGKAIVPLPGYKPTQHGYVSLDLQQIYC